ncbi:MAG: GtrA family protein [Candidatus Eremiobacteraeota bacterium]|nr:GtrA family protein [Candidatus Eremiobacteraeota bacterium]
MLERIKREFLSRQFAKFLLVGGIAASANFFSRFLFRLWFPYVVSVGLSFTLGTVVSFILNKTFTFKSYEESTAVQAFKFALTGLVYIVLGSAVAQGIYWITGHFALPPSWRESLSHALSIAICTVYSFLVIKYFAFRKLELSRHGKQ